MTDRNDHLEPEVSSPDDEARPWSIRVAAIAEAAEVLGLTDEEILSVALDAGVPSITLYRSPPWRRVEPQLADLRTSAQTYDHLHVAGRLTTSRGPVSIHGLLDYIPAWAGPVPLPTEAERFGGGS